MGEIINIGDRLWQFDQNRRVYKKDDQGRAYGGPIFEEQFVEGRIVGENRASWLVKTEHRRDPTKVLKKDLTAPSWGGHRATYYTDAGRADAIWREKHRAEIANRVRAFGIPTDQLRAIAKIIGYDDGSSQ